MEKSNKKDRYNSAFATRLRELIKKKETTIKAVGDVIGVSRQAVSQYCDGSTQPNAETIVKIANHFYVSTDYLLGMSSQPTVDMTVAAICEYTGLGEMAVGTLNSWKRDSKQCITLNTALEFINEFLFFDETVILTDYIDKYVESLKLCKYLELKYNNIDFKGFPFAHKADGSSLTEDELKAEERYFTEIDEVQDYCLYKIQKYFIEKVENYGYWKQKEMSTIEQYLEETKKRVKLEKMMRVSYDGEHTRTQK